MLQVDLSGWLVSAGATAALTHANDSVAQPNGQLSPFSADPSSSDADTFRRNFSTGQSAAFIQAERSQGTR